MDINRMFTNIENLLPTIRARAPEMEQSRRMPAIWSENFAKPECLP